jgi:mannan endo-1,4-beta-mannosidase
MVDNIRDTGAENIIVVCGHAMGQGHEPFLEKGAELLNGRKNIVFDIHAYQTYWNKSANEIESRLETIRSLDIAPVIFGEFAANGEQPYKEVIAACRHTKTSLLAWLWPQYEEPFRTEFKRYCGEPRNIDCQQE